MSFELDIAYVFDDAESRIDGLQNRRIGMGECAVFVYDSPSIPKFWMKDVPTNLHLSSVVGGKCVESHCMDAGSRRVYPLASKTMCVVESRAEIPLGSSVDIIDGRLVVS